MGNLTLEQWLGMLSPELLTHLFNCSTSGDGTKEGGFLTTEPVINELAIRGQLGLIGIRNIKNKEVARKIIAKIVSAERSVAGKISPKIAARFAIEPDGSINQAVMAVIRDIEEAEEAKAKRQEMAQESLAAWRTQVSAAMSPVQKKAFDDARLAVEKAQQTTAIVKGFYCDENGDPLGSYQFCGNNSKSPRHCEGWEREFHSGDEGGTTD